MCCVKFANCAVQVFMLAFSIGYCTKNVKVFTMITNIFLTSFCFAIVSFLYFEAHVLNYSFLMANFPRKKIATDLPFTSQ